jgi:hypothetical protein
VLQERRPIQLGNSRKLALDALGHRGRHGVGSIGLPAILDLGSASSRAALSGTGCAD